MTVFFKHHPDKCEKYVFIKVSGLRHLYWRSVNQNSSFNSEKSFHPKTKTYFFTLWKFKSYHKYGQHSPHVLCNNHGNFMWNWRDDVVIFTEEGKIGHPKISLLWMGHVNVSSIWREDHCDWHQRAWLGKFNQLCKYIKSCVNYSRLNHKGNNFSCKNILRGLDQQRMTPRITMSMGPTWGPPGSCRPQVGPILAP